MFYEYKFVLKEIFYVKTVFEAHCFQAATRPVYFVELAPAQ